MAICFTADFENEVLDYIEAVWPKLVAHELTKLNKSRAKVFLVPRQDSSVSYAALLDKHGSKRSAAQALGIPETTFRRRLAKETGKKAS